MYFPVCIRPRDALPSHLHSPSLAEESVSSDSSGARPVLWCHICHSWTLRPSTRHEREKPMWPPRQGGPVSIDGRNLVAFHLTYLRSCSAEAVVRSRPIRAITVAIDSARVPSSDPTDPQMIGSQVAKWALGC